MTTVLILVRSQAEPAVPSASHANGDVSPACTGPDVPTPAPGPPCGAAPSDLASIPATALGLAGHSSASGLLFDFELF